MFTITDVGWVTTPFQTNYIITVIVQRDVLIDGTLREDIRVKQGLICTLTPKE